MRSRDYVTVCCPSFCLPVCLFRRSIAAAACGGFAAGRPANRIYRSTATGAGCLAATAPQQQMPTVSLLQPPLKAEHRTVLCVVVFRRYTCRTRTTSGVSRVHRRVRSVHRHCAVPVPTTKTRPKPKISQTRPACWISPIRWASSECVGLLLATYHDVCLIRLAIFYAIANSLGLWTNEGWMLGFIDPPNLRLRRLDSLTLELTTENCR